MLTPPKSLESKLYNLANKKDDIKHKLLDRISHSAEKFNDCHCWLWRGCISTRGYGMVAIGGKVKLTHRLAYELFKGPIPDGLELDHLCRVRNCCNPDHLEAVTHEENVRRGESGCKQRSKTHCPSGHEYTPENIYRRPLRPNERRCRTCMRLKNWKNASAS